MGRRPNNSMLKLLKPLPRRREGMILSVVIPILSSAHA